MNNLSILSIHGYPELAVRENSIILLEEGLIELSRAKTNLERNDFFRLLSLYYNSARELEVNPDEYFLRIANNKLKGTVLGDLMIRFTKREAAIKTIEVMGYKVVFTPDFTYLDK